MPNYVGALTLYLENGIKQEFIDKYEGEFVKINDDEGLEELYELVNQINTKEEIVFRVNHGSNASIAVLYSGTMSAAIEAASPVQIVAISGATYCIVS